MGKSDNDIFWYSLAICAICVILIDIVVLVIKGAL
jgi:hypothetical protein